ncbi:hypothetical protein Hanom_Chr16g01449691 [Helianthus anomalus]
MNLIFNYDYKLGDFDFSPTLESHQTYRTACFKEDFTSFGFDTAFKGENEKIERVRRRETEKESRIEKGVGDSMVSLISPSNPIFRVLPDRNYTPISQAAPTSRNSPMISMMYHFEG